MRVLSEMIADYLPLIVGGMALAILLLFICCLLLFGQIRRERKRYDIFMGTGRKPTHSLESKLEEYFETGKNIEEKYDKILKMVNDMDATMKSNVQKVGFVRYNPFDEMGGNLCFAVALLDGNDNGIVINGIHSRTGSFTYAKPIEMGVSTYILSVEEKKAVELAKENAYHPQAEKVLRVKKKKKFTLRERDEEEVLPSLEEETPQEVESDMPAIKMERGKDIGDATIDEQKIIQLDQKRAEKIIMATQQQQIHKNKIEAMEEIKAAEEIEAVEEIEVAEEIEVVEEIEAVEEIEVAEEIEVVKEIEVMEKVAEEKEAVKEKEAVEETEVVEEMEAVEETEAVEEIEVMEETEVAEVVEETEVVEEIEAMEEIEVVEEIEAMEETEVADDETEKNVEVESEEQVEEVVATETIEGESEWEIFRRQRLERMRERLKGIDVDE